MSDKPRVLLIAASTGSRLRNRAFGMKLPLLGYPATNLALVAAVTPESFDISIVDECFEPVPYGQGDIALITGLTHHMPNVYRIADRLRAEGTRVVLCGMHVTALPEEALDHADAVIAGEVEAVWPEVLDDYLHGSLHPRYEGRPADLGSLPLPRRDLVNRKFYHPGEVIETTRGCPVGCGFCNVQNFYGARFRTRPPEQIEAELMEVFGPRPPQARWKEWIARHWHADIPYFIEKRLLYVMDSNLMSEPAHARKVCEVFRRVDLRWYGHVSFNVARNDEMLDLLAESGCMSVNIGFESLNQATINAVGKHTNRVTEYAECVRKLHERGIGVMGTFIVGFDEDGPEVFDRIADFALENQLETAFTLILTPLPGTRVYERMEAEGRITSRDWQDYDHGSVAFTPRNMTPSQLHWGMRSCWKRIYSLRGIRRRILRRPFVRPFFFLPINLGFRKCLRLIVSDSIWQPPAG
ncbi:hypothetical protein DPQ33_02155 [Oceanidesulfovibrio indonesiensis]|uniref:B12-binding domain-containing radical SAM protein n=1 Tax=Oceanidesulfovibrio indonesiensis TaxID=54767 RepID=A0A7M3MHL4_9BACT|nr:radical SAM protein [Oceanidesulfovibrio indonesiensis]TVM19183.1 hypothetical protein DPQ33_02155 [Oceanidesulfovibrio indonesiensis]